MAAQQSSQQNLQSQRLGVRLSRWLLILLIIVSVIAVLSFIGATIFWFGLVRDKLPDAFGAIFTGSGTVFSFVALVIGVPPFIQYLKDRRAVNTAIQGNVFQNNPHQDRSGSQAIQGADNSFGPGANQQKNSPPGRPSPQNWAAPIDPDVLKAYLSKCNETYFNGIVFRMKRYGFNTGILPGSKAAQEDKAIVLIDWADSDAGPGIDVLYDAYQIELGLKKKM
jgi:hypothetical protein